MKLAHAKQLPEILVALKGRRDCTSTGLLIHVTCPRAMSSQAAGSARRVDLLDSAFAVVSPAKSFIVLREASTEELGRKVFTLSEVSLQVQLLAHVVALSVLLVFINELIVLCRLESELGGAGL